MLSFRDRPGWRTVRGGSARYMEALTRPFGERLRLRTPVEAVTRHPDHVLVKPRGGEAERFDEVVLATHSEQALSLLADASDREHEILGAIPYQPNAAVLHTDLRLLPCRRRAWASWNYHLLPEPSRSSPGCSTAGSSRGGPDWCGSVAATTSAIPPCLWTAPFATWSRIERERGLR